MKSSITTITAQYNKGQYMKADRLSDYSICIRSDRDGKEYWIKPSEINSVEMKHNKITSEQFCSLLQIPFK